MRAPAPVALGCVSLVLCLLELPHGLARTHGRRDPPASLLGDHHGAQPLAPPQPPGTPRHSLKLAPHRGPRHGARLAPRHRLLVPKLTPRLGARLAPQHRLLIPKLTPRLGARLAPQHRLLVPKLTPRLGARLAPRRGHRLILRHGARGRRHASGHLLRVGCVLGTCQVQNLSHRLWQLMGQSGRQDSSPMNPNSPHSYG